MGRITNGTIKAKFNHNCLIISSQFSVNAVSNSKNKASKNKAAGNSKVADRNNVTDRNKVTKKNTAN